MRTFLLVAVVAATLGMTGAAMADTSSPYKQISAGEPGKTVSDRGGPTTHLAGNSSVLPSQRPAYLSQSEVALPVEHLVAQA
jgi:hypothetical protein